MAWSGGVQLVCSFVLQTPIPGEYRASSDTENAFERFKFNIENPLAVTVKVPLLSTKGPSVVVEALGATFPLKVTVARRDGATPTHSPNNNSVLKALTLISSVVRTFKVCSSL